MIDIKTILTEILLTKLAKSIIIIGTVFLKEAFKGGIKKMKRRFYVSVLDNNERKVILTGDMLPIEIVVEKTEYISFDIQSNKKIEEDNILYEERQDEIYLTVIGNASKAKGFLRAVIDENHDLIIVHCKYTCKYDSKNQTLRILSWKNETMIYQEYHGPIRRIHVGNIIKVSFFDDTETVKFDINS